MNILLSGDWTLTAGEWRVFLQGDVVGAGDARVVNAVTVVAEAKGGGILARAPLPRAVGIPFPLLEDVAADWTRFRSFETLAADLRVRLRELGRQLGTLAVSWERAGSVMARVGGTGGAAIQGSIRLHLAADVGSTGSSSKLAAEFSLRAEAAGKTVELGLRLRRDGTACWGFNFPLDGLSLPEIEIDLPQLPTLDLRALPPLKLPNLAQAWDDLADVLEPLRQMLGPLELTPTWNPAEPLLLVQWNAAAGALWFALAKPGTDVAVLAGPLPDLQASLATFGLKLTRKSGRKETVLELSGAQLARGANGSVGFPLVPGPIAIEGGSQRFGVFQISWSSFTLTFANWSADPVVTTRISSLTVASVNDPGAVLVFLVDLQASRAGLAVTGLKLVEPHEIEIDLHGPAARILRLAARLKSAASEQIRDVLRVLGRLATSAATALGEAAGNALQGLGEAVAKLLDACQKLVTQAGAATAGLDFEVHIGVAPLELRQCMVTLRDHLGGTAAVAEALGFRLEYSTDWRPALLLDFVQSPGAYLLAIHGGGAGQTIGKLSSDLWLKDTDGDAVRSVRDADTKTGERADQSPILTVAAKLTTPPSDDFVLVLAGLCRGKACFLRRAKGRCVDVPVPGTNAVKVLEEPFELIDPSGELAYDVDFKTDRVLSFFGMGETGSSDPADGGGFLKKLQSGLGQVVKVKGTDGPRVDGRKATIGLLLDVQAAGLTTAMRLGLVVDLQTLQVAFEGPANLKLRSRRIEQEALGLTFVVEQLDEAARQRNDEVEMFVATFTGGESGFALNKEAARMEVRFTGLSADGQGVVFLVSEFKVGRGGVDLVARVDDRAVRLNGLDEPFRFTSGGLTIRGGKLVEAAIAGCGQLPPALVGESTCSISLCFAQSAAGGIVLQSGKVQLDKLGDPVICHSTRFTITLTGAELGIETEGGTYHFYFLVSGSLRFTPKPGEFTDGLLKYLADTEIVLDRTPLASDPRVLAKHISFQKSLNPKFEAKLFNVFRFELRGFGYHPASPKFEGSPAINISGQIELGLGDVMQPKIDFHGLWIAPPRTGESLPRIRADGLGVELQMKGGAKVRGTVLAVDDQTRTVEGRELMPPGYSASGFLGEGALDLPGWGVMQATLGFLEAKSTVNPKQIKNTFFLYLQKEELAVEIPTPFWTFWLREVGFGFGFRYTLAGISEAERATSTAELVRTLDDVSRRQGDLHRFSAWKPDPEKDHFTLALKGAFQAAPAEKPYDAKKEETAQNPFLFDLVMALRSDFTFLLSTRVHLGVNYAHYRRNEGGFRERPLLRGFLYISVPRRELLLRAVSDPGGFIGKDFPLFDDPLVRKALSSVRFSSTLYIRPGLFQYELGWPDQLAVELAKEPNLRLSVRGGMIFRAAEDGLLYGFSVGADAYLRFGGSIGSSIGVAVEAELAARFIARFIAYLAWRFSDSLIYALVSLDARLSFSVRAWMKVDLGFTSFTIRIGFSCSLQLSAAVELVLAPGGMGAHVHARVAVQAFGCTLSVGVGFTFNQGRLDDARARVARFLALSVTADAPPPGPLPAVIAGDATITEEAQAAEGAPSAPTIPVLPVPKPQDPLPPNNPRSNFGREIEKTDFWLILRKAGRAPGGDQLPADDEAYALLVPREAADTNRGGFYAVPLDRGLGLAVHTLNAVPELQAFDPQARKFVPVGGTYDAKARWDAPIPVEKSDGPATFTLAELFDECFLTDTTWDDATKTRQSGNWKEPNSLRLHGAAADPEVSSGSEEERNRARQKVQRSGGAEAAANPFDENAYQGRSTVLTMFLDQFVTLAESGKRADDAAHVTDLGLVFYGKVERLMELANCGITKKGERVLPPGKIAVLNPAEHWFVTSDPVLLQERQAVEPDGIKLDWRLGRAFEMAGDHISSNPEQFLHHYEISRTVEGFEFLPATVRVKAAATVGGPGEGSKVSLLAPDWQFTDTLDGDLSLPPGFREALLPPAVGGDSMTSAIAWLKAFGETEEVTFTYIVTPVDIAGSRGLPKSFTVDVRRPVAPVRPALAELRVIQTVPNEPKTPKDEHFEIYLAISDSAWREDPPAQSFGSGTDKYSFIRRYRLIAQTEEIEPAGQYGFNAATARVRSPRSVAPIRASDPGFMIPRRTGTISVQDPKAAAALAAVEGDAETRLKFDRWARLTRRAGAPSGDPFPVALTSKELQGLLDLVAARQPYAGTAVRFALETQILVQREGDREGRVLSSACLPVSVEQRVEGPNRAGTTLKPEALEAPRLLALAPPGRGGVQTGSGFARFRVPAANATLAQLLEGANPLRLQRDADRRILTTVRFAAQGGSESAGYVAGYHLFELDLDDLVPPARLAADPAEDEKMLKRLDWSRARLVGRVEHVPDAEARLLPDSTADFLNWQAHYPSETRRLERKSDTDQPGTLADGSMPIRSAWYSPRESTAQFPAREPRQRFFPVAPEDAIASLMRKGRPRWLRLDLRVKPGSPAWRLLLIGWQVPRPTLVADQIAGVDLRALLEEKPHEGGSVISRRAVEGGGHLPGLPLPFEPSDVRHALLAAGFTAFAGRPALLQAWRDDPGALDGLEVHLEGFTKYRRRISATAWEDAPSAELLPGGESADGRQRSTGSVTLDLDLRSPIHPFLEEVLGELAYGTREIGAKAALYRAYTVIPQAPPPVVATKADDFLGKTPPASDPYGWGALQRLGLAVSLRMFDEGTNDFLSSKALAKRVKEAIASALPRWAKVDLGQPFAELCLKPGRDREAGPFEAVLKSELEAEDARLTLDADGLSLVQVSLRPSPVLVWQYQTLSLSWRDRESAQSEPLDVVVPPGPNPWVLRRAGEDGQPGPEFQPPEGSRLIGRVLKRQRLRSVVLRRSAVAAPAIQLARQTDGVFTSYGESGSDAGLEIPIPKAYVQRKPGEAERPVQLPLVARLATASPDPDSKPYSPSVGWFSCTSTWDDTTGVEIEGYRSKDGIAEVGPFFVVRAPQQDAKSTVDSLPLGHPSCPLSAGEWQPVTEPAELTRRSAGTPTDPFEIFPEWSPNDWAAAMGGTWDQPPTKTERIPAAEEAYDRFRHTLRAAGVVAPDRGSSSRQVPLLAGSLLNWLQRFLDHGAPPAAANEAKEAGSMMLALAAPIQALPWRLAPDPDGCFTLSFLHSDRWAHARAYTVKPIARYQQLLESIGVAPEGDDRQLLPPGKTWLPDDAGWAVAVSPRTEKVQPPMLLGISRVRWSNDPADSEEALQLVLARHAEEQLAHSNRALFARLGVPTSLLTFARIYRRPDWLKLLNSATGVQVEPLPEVISGKLSRPVGGRQMEGPMLAEMVGAYPQLWKGAQIWRFDPLPPHYKFVALAAERAGVVVSKIASTIQDQQPRRALFGRGDALLSPAGHEARLSLVEVDGNVRLQLRHGLVSHDALTPEAARLAWQDKAGPSDVCWVPDPDVAYVLERRSVSNGQTTQVEEDVELRLGAGRAPIMPRARGSRYRAEGALLLPPLVEDGKTHFFAYAELAVRDEAVSAESLRLTSQDWGSVAQMQKFNADAAAFAEIVRPARVTVDLAPQPGETADNYLERLRVSNEATQAQLAGLPSGSWQERERKRALLGLLESLGGWIAAKKASGVGDATAPDLQAEAGLPRELSDVPLGRNVPALPAEFVRWSIPELPEAAEAYLLVTGLASDEALQKLDGDEYPPLARAGGLLRRTLRRWVLGGADAFWLRAIDLEARLVAQPAAGQPALPGVCEHRITLPAWMTEPA